MPAAWKSPREIAFIYDDEGSLESISVARAILTADGFVISRGMRNYRFVAEEDEEEQGPSEVSPELEALAEQVILRKVTELVAEPVA